MTLEHLNEVVQKLCDDSGFDHETAKFVIETYLKQADDILDTLLILIQHDTHNAYKEIEGLMHKLKGASGNVRATHIMNLAMEAELFAKHRNSEQLTHIHDEISKGIKMYWIQLKEGVK